MRSEQRKVHARTARLVVAALLLVSISVGSATVSLAAPSRQQVAAAQAKLDQLNNRLEILTEDYDQALSALHQVEARLADMRSFAQQARAQAEAAQALLSARVVSEFTGAGSQLEVLLGSTSLTQFSDRLTFLSNLVGGDSDVATQAQVKRQIARRAAADLAVIATKRQTLVNNLDKKRTEIQSGISEQRALVAKMQDQLSKAEAAAKAAAERKAALAAQARTASSIGSPTSYSPPPGVSGGAGAAVAAAYSALGVPYRWGGASPSTGFDCSGLTMWAWAHGGVSLPHSSSMQYAVLPHISRSDLQPGDLVFFYYPIHHVAIYVGGGMMIHAPHEGGVVSVTSLAGYPSYVGAARP
jgi:cell wall-associated NlpC family hydrolase